MTNVVDFTGTTTLDLDPDKVLEGAKGELEEVMIIGLNKHDEIWISHNKSDMANLVYLLERAKHVLMQLEP